MIEIKNAAVRLAGRELLSGLNWQLADPGNYLLLGTNGSGKSLVCSLLAGRIKPVTGSIEIDGEPIGRGQSGLCFYADATKPPPAGESLWEYLKTELQNTGSTAVELDSAWKLVEGFYTENRDISLSKLSHGQYLLLHVLLATLIPARLALLDGHLTWLNLQACACVEYLLAHMPAGQDRYFLFTSNRYAYFQPRVDAVFVIDPARDGAIQPLSEYGRFEEPGESAEGAIVRLVLRQEWSASDALVSGSNFKLVSRSDGGIRLRLNGSFDGMLAELAEMGIRPWKIEWES